MRMAVALLGVVACSYTPPALPDDQPETPVDAPVNAIDAPMADAMPDQMLPPDAPPAFDPATDCPATYTASLPGVTTSRYRVISGSASWPTQQADCADDLAGATHLVTYESAGEQQGIFALMGNGGFLVGYFQQANATTLAGDWFSVLGDPPAGTQWALGQPNDNGGVENHEQDRGFVGNSAGLQDGPASFSSRAVCECDGKAIPPEIANQL